MKKILSFVCAVLILTTLAAACSTKNVDASVSVEPVKTAVSVEKSSTPETATDMANESEEDDKKMLDVLDNYRAWTIDEWNAADEETKQEIAKQLFIRVGDALVQEGAMGMTMAEMALLAESDAEVAVEFHEYVDQFAEMIGTALASDADVTFGEYADAMEALVVNIPVPSASE